MKRIATIAQALTEEGPVISVRPDRIGDQQHIWWLPDGRIITVGIGPVPARSTWRPGDRVVGHGWQRADSSVERQGFRGFVLGSIAAGSLFGLTDDGQLWHSSPAILDPADRAQPWESCPCCPHPPRRPAPAGQGDLLDLIGVGA